MIINFFYYIVLLLILFSLYLIYLQKININKCKYDDSNINFMNVLEIPLFIFTGLLFLLPPQLLYFNNIIIILFYVLILLIYYILYITYIISLQKHNVKILSDIIKKSEKMDCIKKKYYENIFYTGIIVQITQGFIISILLILSFIIRRKKKNLSYN